jgi:hypothetical protein
MQRTTFAALASLLVTVTPAAAQAPRGQIEPTVKAIRAQYPAAVIGSQIGEILNAVAWQHRPNVKILKKGGGGNCPAPHGVTISCDILIWAPPGTAADQTEHIDVLSGASAEGLATASPFWKSAGPCTKRPASHPMGGSGCDMKNALEPIAPGDTGVVTPPDPIPTQPPPLELEALIRTLTADLTARLEALAAALGAQHTAGAASLEDLAVEVRELRAAADALAARKLP